MHALYPERLNNKTNGITPRRWLLKANPELASLVSRSIGDGWPAKLGQLRMLEAFADDGGFQSQFEDSMPLAMAAGRRGVTESASQPTNEAEGRESLAGRQGFEFREKGFSNLVMARDFWF